jgi:hypothetical protein
MLARLLDRAPAPVLSITYSIKAKVLGEET